VSYRLGGGYITTTDCDVILGYIDPDYFLGGRIKLDREAAAACMEETIAGPTGLSVEAAARGIKEIIDVRMRDAATGMIMAKGFDVSDYYCLAFGGAGATHAAGYTEGVKFKGVMVFPYSAVFSAFGASSANYEHHYNHALTEIVPPDAQEAHKLAVGRNINTAWERLENRAHEELKREGFSTDQIRFEHLVMVRYGRQLEDLIVTSPVERIGTPGDWDAVVQAFERMYEEVYTAAGKYPAAGYEVFEVGLIASVEKIKPVLKKYPLQAADPAKAALKTKRPCYFREGWVDTPVYDYTRLQAGNFLTGPAMIENETTVVVVPPRNDCYVDEYLTAWLKEKGRA
jgi:acetone carboxylase beta subunit